MRLYPAIDLMNGQVVRLIQGKAEQKIVYSNDPPAMARLWREQGAEYLHLVDLDGAFTGEPANLDVVRALVQESGLPCQLGGGMRTPETVERALQAGVSRVILGSKVCDSPETVTEFISRFGAESIVVGIDARDGHVATRGWVDTSPRKATELAIEMEQRGVKTIVYTDIATDGMLSGPNLEAMREMLTLIQMDLIASGGVSSLNDLKELNNLAGLHGVIVGRALYDQKFTLPEALSTASR